MVNTGRQMVQIPKDSKVYDFLYGGSNHTKKAKWELLEHLVVAIPTTKQERAHGLFIAFVKEFEILYPNHSFAFELLWRFIAKRIMKISDLDGKEVILGAEYFEELSKI